MKLDNRHLRWAVAALGVAILYNVYVYVRPEPARKGALPSPVPGPAAAGPTQLASAAPVDPASIPPPPAVAMTPAPQWGRDPFVRLGQPVAEAAEPTGPEPVVTSILFSGSRKLAIVDGRVVGIGDSLPLGVIVDIAPNAVVVQTASGDQRRLALNPFGRSVQGVIQVK